MENIKQENDAEEKRMKRKGKGKERLGQWEKTQGKVDDLGRGGNKRRERNGKKMKLRGKLIKESWKWET